MAVFLLNQITYFLEIMLTGENNLLKLYVSY